MAGDKKQSKPTKAETAANLLRLGGLLNQLSYPIGELGLTRPIMPEEAEKLHGEIQALEKRIEEAVNDLRQWTLRSIFSIKGQGIVDILAVRIAAYVAWANLVSERPEVSVARVANAVGDLSVHLEARKTIRQMLAKGSAIRIKDSDFSSGQLLPGDRLIRFLSGEGNPAIVFSAQNIEEEKEAAQKGKGGEVSKNAQSTSHPAGPLAPAETSIEAPYLLTAKGIFNVLKDQVIGIDGPLRRFSAQMSLHMRRLEQIRKGIRPSVGPIVTLLIGSSSSGKSWTCECAAKSLGLPFSLADMSSVSMSSFCGLDFDSCFYSLLANRTPPALAQQGLVVLDEFDKVASHKEYSQGVGVQCEVLKPLDGCRFVLGGRRANTSHMATLDTYETCFVLAGAFDGIRETLAHMQKESIGLGFGGGREEKASDDIRSLLVKFGLMSQIVHRIGSIIIYPDQTPDQVIRIITHSKGLLAKQNAFLWSFGIRLLPTNEAIRHMADWSCETRGYSRAVKTLLGAMVEGHLIEDRKGDIQVSVADVKRAIEETEGTEGLA